MKLIKFETKLVKDVTKQVGVVAFALPAVP
jgi:hypothetical protein